MCANRYFKVCPNLQLKNGGSCFDGNGTQEVYCQCLNLFNGLRCEIDLCDDQECLNGGSCILDESSGSDFQVKCDCIQPFTGPQCEINLCDDKVCLNGGNCFVQESMEKNFIAKCNCVYGFDGDSCERDICEDHECKNSGNCTIDDSDPLNLEPTCDCSDEFVGEKCEIPLVCYEGDPCQNEGQCQLLHGKNSSDQDCLNLKTNFHFLLKVQQLKIYECLCSEGFAGVFCENKKQSNHLLYLINNNILIYNPEFTMPKQIAPDSRVTPLSHPPIYQSCSTVLYGRAYVFGGSRAPRQVKHTMIK